MTHDSKELKPCPFCGGDAWSDFSFTGKWQTSCKECHCGTSVAFEYRSLAEAAWNTRPAPQPGMRAEGEADVLVPLGARVRQSKIHEGTRDGTVIDSSGRSFIVKWDRAVIACTYDISYLLKDAEYPITTLPAASPAEAMKMHPEQQRIADQLNDRLRKTHDVLTEEAQAAPPKPPPDAMREALRPFADVASGHDKATGKPNADHHPVQVRLGDCRAARVALSAPVPPPDGVAGLDQDGKPQTCSDPSRSIAQHVASQPPSDDVRSALALLQEIVDLDSHGRYGRLAREAIDLLGAPAIGVTREALAASQ